MSASNVCTSVLDSAYEEFVEDVFMKTSGASDTVALLQSLCYVRVEFMGLQHRLACGPEKNASLVPYVEKAVWLLDSQVEFIEGRIQNEKVFAECPLRKPEKSSRILKWTNKTVDYVEWIYALCEVLNLNGEKVTLKTLFGVFNGLFGIDVKEYSLYFTGIKNRKKGDRTSFLDLQKQLLIRRMEEADRRPDGKRGLDKRG